VLRLEQPTMSITISPTNWQTHQADLSRIRTEVFIREQQISVADEWDGFDQSAIHFLVNSAHAGFIGCARLLTESQPDGSYVYHIGRLALLEAFRNKGIGRQLMVFIITYCQQHAPNQPIYLHAQTTRRAFYERLGFKAQGDEFMDAGIPHIAMWLK
jgi:predicted GNAT family N-acyltransferase